MLVKHVVGVGLDGPTGVVGEPLVVRRQVQDVELVGEFLVRPVGA